jgi:threonine/homoserine/homoserine lactone efflux protein
MDALLIGIGAGFGIAIPVGAIAVLIIETGIRGGFRPAMAAGAGAATADFLYSGAAVAGGVGLASAIESFEDPLRFVSAFVLVGIAILGLRRGRVASPSTLPHAADADRPLATYRKFVGLTLINPQTVIYFAAFIVGLGVATSMTAVEGALFVAGAGAASLSWQTFIAGVGAFAGQRLPPPAQRTAIVAGNLIVLGFAVVILLG